MSKVEEQTRRSPKESSILSILTAVGSQEKVIYGDTIKNPIPNPTNY